MIHNQPVPLTLTFMLACHYAADPVREIGFAVWSSNAGTFALEWLRKNELIDDRDRATDRGREWIKRLCATPLPAGGPVAVQPYWKSENTPAHEPVNKGVRVRYAYASRPTIFHFVKDGPRKHRRFPSREAAQTYITNAYPNSLAGTVYEIVD
jgi:sugar (pentulose or hexulose) kinase